MNQKQLADSINKSSSTVRRYIESLIVYKPDIIQRKGKRLIFDDNACRAIKYMNDLVNSGLEIKEAVNPVMRDVYDIDADNAPIIECQNCKELQDKIDAYKFTLKQQRGAIEYLLSKING